MKGWQKTLILVSILGPGTHLSQARQQAGLRMRPGAHACPFTLHQDEQGAYLIQLKGVSLRAGKGYKVRCDFRGTIEVASGKVLDIPSPVQLGLWGRTPFPHDAFAGHLLVRVGPGPASSQLSYSRHEPGRPAQAITKLAVDARLPYLEGGQAGRSYPLSLSLTGRINYAKQPQAGAELTLVYLRIPPLKQIKQP